MESNMTHPTLIIGAGMAGLGAARYLQDKGQPVLVLEARDRLGGRVHTDHSWGVPLDLGASLIHGSEGNPMVELAQRYQAHIQPTFFDFNHTFLVDLSSRQPITSETFQRWHTIFEQLVEAADRYAQTLAQDISLEQALKYCMEKNEALRIPKNYYAWFLERLGAYIGDNVSRLSARHWNQEVRLKGNHLLLQKGYKTIIDGLAEGIPIRLNTEVKRINYTQNQIEVETTSGLYTGSAVIITLPLGVLKANRVKFEPELPVEKQRAIQRLGMGVFDKILLKFPEQFWPSSSDFIGFLTENYESSFVFLNLVKNLQMPILFGGIFGDAAYHMEKQKDNNIVEQQLNLLSQIFGQKISLPLDFKVTRWSCDPYSLGSYSYLAVGSSGKDFELMAEPVGERLLFAGEATHREYPGTTHGAYLSGLREAQRLAN
jgi:polyamine oxidase